MTTYYVDGVDGNDANAGTSEGAGNAWATIDKAMNTVAAGDVVYVKAGSGYTELATIDTAGNTSSFIEFIGYGTTTGDDGLVTWNASGASCLATASATEYYYRFHNFIFDGGTSHAVNLGNSSESNFFNCTFRNAGGAGLFGNDKIGAYYCTFANNTTEGYDCDLYGHCVGCKVYGNGGHGISHGIANLGFDVGNLIYGVAANKEGIRYSVFAVNNTVDCEGNSGTVGIRCSVDSNWRSVHFNNILHDCNDGMINAGTLSRFPLVQNNLFSSCTTNYNTARTHYGHGKNDIDDVAGFSDEAGDDYTLAEDSLARGAGLGVEP